MNKSQVASFLIAAGSAAPSADNMQPWCFSLEGDELVLKFDAERMQATSFPLWHPATMLTMGAVIQNLEEALKSLQLRFKLVPTIPHTQPYEFLRLTLTESQCAVPPDNLPLFARHTNRYAFSTESIPEQLQAELAVVSQGAARLHLVNSEEHLKRIAALVRHASRVRFQTQEVHEWFRASLRFSKTEVERGDGLDIATFDLPPGGRAFMRMLMASWQNMALFNRIGGYRMMAGIEAASIVRAGAVVAVIGEGSANGALDAGRLMQRTWTKLNQAGLAVQPYYVVSDQLTRLAYDNVPEKLREQAIELRKKLLSTFAFGDGCTLHMLLRIGKPKRHAVRSRRLPNNSQLPPFTG